VEFRVLGPFEVVDGDRALELGGSKQRGLLAMLVLHAGRGVSIDTLIDGLWGDRAPATVTKSLQVYVSRLRKLLGEDVIVTRAPGYALAVTPEDVDLGRFERLTEEARTQPPAEAAVTLRTALDLWHGPALADLANEPFAGVEVARLEDLRQAALEARIDADLALGRHTAVVAELEALVRSHPYRERLTGHLMVALYRAGRQADALQAYRDARSTLAGELGIEPGPQLRELEQRILSHDPSLAAPSEPEDRDEAPRRRGRRRVLALVGAVVAAASVAMAAIAVTSRGTESPIVASPNSLAVIDPQHSRVTATISTGPRPTTIAVHGDDVWVLHPDTRTLSHVSGHDHKLIGTVGLGGAPSGLAADARGAWVSDARTASLTLIEAERLTATRRIETRPRPLVGPNSDAGNVAEGVASLWLASGDSTITRIDPRSGHVLARIPGVATGESLGGIAFGHGSVWVAGPVQDSPITRIDPRTNRVVARIPLQKFRSNGIATTRDGVWVSDIGSNQVWRILPSRNVPVSTVQVGLAPLGVAAGAGSLWVANSGDGTVTRIDPVSGRVVETIAVGGSPNGIAAVGDEIWVTVD
jgi:YVTN family beta-propeller protein